MPNEKKNMVADQKILETVTEQLNNALTSLKEQLGEKKFKKRIKRAAEKLVAGIKTTPVKKAAGKIKKKAVVKKKAAKVIVKKKAK